MYLMQEGQHIAYLDDILLGGMTIGSLLTGIMVLYFGFFKHSFSVTWLYE